MGILIFKPSNEAQCGPPPPRGWWGCYSASPVSPFLDSAKESWKPSLLSEPRAQESLPSPPGCFPPLFVSAWQRSPGGRSQGHYQGSCNYLRRKHSLRGNLAKRAFINGGLLSTLEKAIRLIVSKRIASPPPCCRVRKQCEAGLKM